MEDLVENVLERLRMDDGTCGPLVLVAYETDTKHPIGFNGHNHQSCKIPVLLCKLVQRDGKRHFAFVELDCNTEEHRQRRQQGRRPKWNDDEVWFQADDALDTVGAATYLAVRVKYHQNLDLMRAGFADIAITTEKELGDDLRSHRFLAGLLKVDSLEAANSALAVMRGTLRAVPAS